MKQRIAQGLIFFIAIFIIPWIWLLAKDFIDFKYLYQLLYFVAALIVNIIFIMRLNSIIWKLILLSLILIPFSMELMHFFSFQIHWANNDVHYVDPSTGIIEMYKDYDSFFDFSYTDGNWRFRLMQAIYNVVMWLIPFVIFFLFSVYKEKNMKKLDVLDSDN